MQIKHLLALIRDIQLIARIFMARSVGGCDFSVQRRLCLNFQFSAGENSFFGWFGHKEESLTDWWSSKFSMVLLCQPFFRCFRFSSMASCRAASIAAFAHCMPKKSSSVSLQELRAAFLTKYRAEGKIITYPRASTVAQSLTLL